MIETIHQTSLDWQAHVAAGQKYLKVADNGRQRPEVFTNALIYQLTAMGIENLLVGLWQYCGHMPYDHTLDGLVDGLVSICPLEDDLAQGIKAVGRFDDMCPLAPPKAVIPNDQEIRDMLAIGYRTADFVQSQCVPAATAAS